MAAEVVDVMMDETKVKEGCKQASGSQSVKATLAAPHGESGGVCLDA